MPGHLSNFGVFRRLSSRSPGWRFSTSRRTILRSFLALCIATSVFGAPDILAAPQSAAGGNWAAFTVLRDPVFEGNYIASDPSLIDEGEFLRMYYTCWILPKGNFDPPLVRAAICQATSTDGLNWKPLEVDGPTPGLMLRGIEGSWEDHLEAAFVFKVDNTYLLYYSGYRTVGDPALGCPAALSVAVSSDGVHFERVSNVPLLAPTPGWYDNDAIYSPSIVVYDNQFLIVYAGHCYTNCSLEYGNTLLGALSSDGFTWQKLEDPILSGGIPCAAWTKDGVAEPAVFAGPDDLWYLFVTGLEGDNRAIGIAASESPFGPWLVSADPIIVPQTTGFSSAGVLAPDVLIEGSTVRLWFLGTANDDYAIGYATAEWPLLLDSSDIKSD